MWSQYGQKDKTLDWDKYPLLKPYWIGFKKYKQSEKATKISQENKMNTKKKVIYHTTGSRGYAGKEETWQEQEEKAIQSSVTHMTTNWTERNKRFVLGHGAVLTTEGRLEFKIDQVKQVAEMIEKAHTESEEGTFVPSRDMDELNYALQSMEHPGCTRGYGNKHRKHALKSTADSYGKKRKHDELFKDKIQEMVQNILQAEREKMHESFQGHIQEHVQAQLQRLLAEQGNALVLHNPGGHRSSCASVTAIKNDDNRYPIDDMEESKECRLVTPVLGITRTVVYGLARPFIQLTLFNSHPIPKGYAIVHVDKVKPGHRRSKLEYPRENGE
jgi:hypothetical protein